MLITSRKVKVNLTKTAQGIEQEDPRRDELHKQQMRKKRRKEHFPHFKTLNYETSCMLKRTTVKTKENKFMNMFK
jgi:hypothetical protein